MDADKLFSDGLIFYYGNNKPEGIRLLKMAADEGHADAMCTLGMHYRKLYDYENANKYFEAGAALGEPSCMYYLAGSYARGEGKPIDHVKAYELVLKSIEHGKKVEPFMVEIYKAEAKRANKHGFMRWLRR